jgi:hypothetical protein
MGHANHIALFVDYCVRERPHNRFVFPLNQIGEGIEEREQRCPE